MRWLPMVLTAAALILVSARVVVAVPPADPQVGAGGAVKGKPAATAADPVVARVNGRPILRRDFDLAVQIQFRGRRKPVGLKELQTVRDKVLENLIESELLYQKAVKSAPPVADQEVEKEYEKMKSEYPSSDAFAATLKSSGVAPSEFKDQLRRTLLVTHFVESEVVGEVVVSDEEVRRYYDQNPTEMVRPESVHLSQILVIAFAGAPRERRAESREKIEAILKELRSGGDFADLARKHSEGKEASNGGDLGWVALGAGPPAIETAAAALLPGQTSDVVESRIGFHLLKVVDRRPAGPIPFEDARDNIRNKLSARGRQEKIEAYVEKLKEQARVERVLKTTS